LNKKFSEIASNYDAFIVDLWGVIHDGQNLYPGVMQTLQALKSMNKKVLFLSNAPRRAEKVKEVLGNFGITPDLYIDAVSSGEVTYQILKINYASAKYIYIGPDKDRCLLGGLNFEEVSDASKADFAITTGFDKDDSTLAEKLPQIESCLKAGLKLYCANPDLIVVRQDGTKMLCAGVIGEYYQQEGGKVEFIGKPHKEVYEYALKALGTNKILAVGDSPETDIKGANNMNIDSVLLLGGILKAESRPLAEVLIEKQAEPTYIIENFSW